MLRINPDCIVCGACDYVCPNHAIVPDVRLYRIEAALCTECQGHFDEPQCVASCPVDCIVPLADLLAEPQAGDEAK